MDWCRLLTWPVAKFIVPYWGDNVDYGIGLSYRPATYSLLYVAWRAGTYDNPITLSTLSPQSRITNRASEPNPFRKDLGRHEHQTPVYDLCIIVFCFFLFLTFIENFPLPPQLSFLTFNSKNQQSCGFLQLLYCRYPYLKGLFHEMDLAFDDMYTKSHYQREIQFLHHKIIRAPKKLAESPI